MIISNTKKFTKVLFIESVENEYGHERAHRSGRLTKVNTTKNLQERSETMNANSVNFMKTRNNFANMKEVRLIEDFWVY